MQFLLLQFCPPSVDTRTIGVFLFDPVAKSLTWKLRDDWAGFAGAEDVEYLSYLAADLVKYARDMGAEQFLAYLEDTLSNILRLTGRREIEVVDPELALEQLFAEHVCRSEG